ncbi:nucleobase:cation symporter-2 family protein [Pseudomonas aeruginosa]
MSVVTDRRIPDSPVDQRLPLTQLLLVGFQHVLLMYGGAVAVPLIVGQAAGLSREEIAFLINADLLVAGIATLVQSLGIGPMGIRMPVMMGASFAAVGSMVAMAGMPGVGITGIFGATIAAGFFGMLIAPFMSRIVRFFPPLVTGTVITSIGMCLFPVAINWAGGGKGAEDFGSLHFLFLSSLVLCTILLINRFMRGFWVNISVLMGMGLGYAIAGGMGMVDLGGLAERPWFDIVTPLHFGAPTFDLAPILSMCLVVVIIFVESTGMFLALGKITGREITPTELRRGLLCDAGIAMFGMVAASGIQILHEANITDRRNQLLVAVSIGMGMVPVVRPDFFARLPVWMEPITHSGIAMTAIWAVVLNLLFNILSRNDRSHLCGSHAPAPKHS